MQLIFSFEGHPGFNDFRKDELLYSFVYLKKSLARSYFDGESNFYYF
jgi:hypothetical protein